MKLQTKGLLLREVNLSDVPNIHILNSFPEVDQFNTLGIPKNIDETTNLITPIISAQLEIPRTRYVWIIENTQNNFIGLIGINLGKANYSTAEIWYKLNPNYWNQGHCSEVVKCVLAFSFTNLKLHRITAGCATQNIASIKVLEKCGFIREGHHRKILPIRGEWVDNYEYAILETDWIKIV